jgi:hypothetical protein
MSIRSSFHMFVFLSNLLLCLEIQTHFQDLGPITNFVSIFGSNPLLWCWPLWEVPTSGLKFPVANGHGEWIEFARRGWDEYEGEEGRPGTILVRQ